MKKKGTRAGFGEGLDALEGDPGSDEVDPQHLPERAPVDLVDEALQTRPVPCLLAAV